MIKNKSNWGVVYVLKIRNITTDTYLVAYHTKAHFKTNMEVVYVVVAALVVEVVVREVIIV